MLKSSLCLAVALSLFGCSRSALELGEINDRDETAGPSAEPPGPSTEPGEPPEPGLHFMELDAVPGALRTDWNAVSGDGSTVVGVVRWNDGDRYWVEPILWTLAGRLTRLDPAPLGEASLTAVGADGATLGGTSTANGAHGPFLWRDGRIEYLDATGELKAMSPDSRFVVGNYLSRPDYIHGFLWSRESGQIDLGTIGSEEQSSALAVSASGNTVAGESGERGFLWTAERGAAVLELPPGDDRSRVRDVSADGAVIAGQSSSFQRSDWTPMLWIDGAPTPLRVLAGATDNAVNALTPDARFAAGKSGEAALWTRDGRVESLRSRLERLDVDLRGWVLAEALDFSEDGRAVFGIGARDGTASYFLAWL
jgi:uncharacterized membrane protein